MRPIDVDALIKELSTMYKEPTSTEDFMTIGYDKAIADVVVTAHRQPTVDTVPVKHGKWVEIPQEPFAPIYECSECGHEPAVEYDGWLLSDYCPFCGAKMDGVGADMKGEDDAEVH